MDPNTNQHTDDPPTDPTNETDNDDPVPPAGGWRKAGWVCAIAPEGCPTCAADDARKRALAAHQAAGAGAA
jgi:hypothetical protein